MLRLLLGLALLVASGCGAATEPRSDAGSGSDAGAIDGAISRDGGVRDGASSSTTYEVVGYATALIRFSIVARRADTGTCTGVLFVGPSEAPTPGLSLPAGWAVQNAWRGPLDGCGEDPFSLPPGTEAATTVTGTASWPDDLCAVTVDLTVGFADGSVERLVAEDVPSDFGGC